MAEFARDVTLAMTGASGAQYGLRLLECLVAADCRVHFMLSKAAQMVAAIESDWKLPAKERALQAALSERLGATEGQIRCYGREEWTAPVASGSSHIDAMVICPASTGVLSALATGASNNLIERAADVMLKERRQLIVVPRETPLSAVHLENMLKLSRLGVVILPASPGFYQQPATVADMVDFIVARVLNQLGIEQQLLPPWGYDRGS